MQSKGAVVTAFGPECAPVAEPVPMPSNSSLPPCAGAQEASAPEVLAGKFLTQDRVTENHVLQLFDLLPGEPPQRGVVLPTSKAFSIGLYRRGGVVALRSNSSIFPLTAKLLCRYVSQVLPSHTYNVLTLNQDLAAACHKDTQNLPHSQNLVCPISSFEGGDVWVEDPSGDREYEHEGATLKGKILGVSRKPQLFEARDRLRATLPWLGRRVVLISYSTGVDRELDAAVSATLRNLGFNLPCRAVGTISQPPAVFIEVFSGCARLSHTVAASGLPSLAVDKPGNPHTSLMHFLPLDLTRADCLSELISLCSAPCVKAVHFGLPCGTGSRAREIPISRRLRLQGAPQPKPLRSEQHVLGLPNLKAADRARVDAANKLASAVVDVIHSLWRSKVFFVVENPVRSHMWSVLAYFVRQKHDMDFSRWWSQLHHCDMDACMWGSERKKATRLLCSRPWLMSMALPCSGDHEHKPFQVYKGPHSWHFDSASEAEYPSKFCAEYARLLLPRLQSSIAFPPTPPAGLAQKRKSPALLQEKGVSGSSGDLLPEHEGLPIGKRSLVSPEPAVVSSPSLPFSRPCSLGLEASGLAAAEHGGSPLGERSLVSPEPALVSSPSPPCSRPCSLGLEAGGLACATGDAPDGEAAKLEFLSRAEKMSHPFDSQTPLLISDLVKRNAFDLLTKGLAGVAGKRLDSAKMVARLKAELASQEAHFHAGLPPHAQQVLQGKNVLLWRHLLKVTHFPDLEVGALMEGVSLVGKPAKSPLFDHKEVPASTSPEMLLSSSAWMRARILSRDTHASEPALARELWKVTLQDVERGFLKGPYDSVSQVKEALGCEAFVCSRRFVIEQGHGDHVKYRPIDDLKESGVNSAYHAVDRLRLMDLDYFCVLARFLAKLSAGREVVVPLSDGVVLKAPLHKDFGGRPRWVGRCLDLEKAYRQVPLALDSLKFGVIVAHRPDGGKPAYFISQSIHFGASASVFAFNRMSLSLFHLSCALLGTLGGVYYDDYPLIEPEISARMATLSIESLLDALGWRYATGDSKAAPFASVFDLLGIRVSLSCLGSGSFEVSTKPARLERIKSLLEMVAASGTCSRSTARSLHGLLNFLVGAAMGRRLKLASRAFANLGVRGEDVPASSVRQLCKWTIEMLGSSTPRWWDCLGRSDPVVIFTDASYEKGIARWGVVVIDPVTSTRRVASGLVPEQLLAFWHLDIKDQVICQAEAFASLVARFSLARLISRRRVLYFVDNESARLALISGSSPSRTLAMLGVAFHSLELTDRSLSWLERVPSEKNIADLPSRDLSREAAALIGGEVASWHLPAELVRLCVQPDAFPWDLLSKPSKP